MPCDANIKTAMEGEEIPLTFMAVFLLHRKAVLRNKKPSGLGLLICSLQLHLVT